MAEMISQRVNSLSTRYLGFYKNSVLILLVSIAVLLLGVKIEKILSGERWGSALITFGYMLFLIYGWIRMNRNVYRVEFDDQFLYVILKGQDIMIPLANIKDIEIKTMGGVYEVELFTAEQLGKKFYFKPSLLYPFNFKKKDALVDVLRKYIDKAKKDRQQLPTNALHS
jgi:hypothetical protein